MGKVFKDACVWLSENSSRVSVMENPQVSVKETRQA